MGRRKRTKTTLLLAAAAAAVCLLSGVNAQDAGGAGTGSAAGSAGGVTVGPTTAPPTATPTSKPPVAVTEAPSPTPSPSPTTSAPSPVPTTTAPAPTVTAAAPEVTTETPTATPTVSTKSKTKKNETDSSSLDAGSATAETAAPETTIVDRSSDAATSNTALSPASTPGSGVSYGGKSTDSSRSSEEATTKSSGDSTKTAIQFVAVAAGVLGVVAAVAMSVHFHQKRRALARDYDDDDKYLNPAPKRETVVDLNTPATTTSATAAAPSGAILYDNFSTPQATAPGWGAEKKTTAPTSTMNAAVTKPMPAPTTIGEKPVPMFRDTDGAFSASTMSTDALSQSTASGVVTTAAGAAATFVGRTAGENDVTGGDDAVDRATAVAGPAYVDGDFREARVTVKHITRCRGQSEASIVDDSDGLSQYGAGLLRSTFITDDPDEDGYTNTQMFAFSDSGSEADRDSSRSDQSRGQGGGAASDVSKFLKFYDGPIVKPQPAGAHGDVDVDVDGYDDDEEDIVGRSTRASSLFDDVRASDFTVGHPSRMSTSSSIADFHDSTVDRPSDLDDEEYEV